MDWVKIVRWIHILAGAVWLGGVLTIIFVIVPAVAHTELGEVDSKAARTEGSSLSVEQADSLGLEVE